MEINKRENRKAKVKNKSESWFFKKINKIVETLARLTTEKNSQIIKLHIKKVHQHKSYRNKKNYRIL